VERFFGTLNESVLRALPGYTGSNVQQRPKDAEKDAQLTLRDIERIIGGLLSINIIKLLMHGWEIKLAINAGSLD
jgi:hypothetical protein